MRKWGDFITRNSFITELSKLIVFMTDTDREMAVEAYEKLFDSCEDENAVLSSLVSPTRQAVSIARVYDAKARKEAIENGDTEKPQFIETIEKIAERIAPAFSKKVEAAVETPAEMSEGIQETETMNTEENTASDDVPSEKDTVDEICAQFSPSEAKADEQTDKEQSEPDTGDERFENKQTVSDETSNERLAEAVAAIAFAMEETAAERSANISRIKEKTRDIYEDDEPVKAAADEISAIIEAAALRELNDKPLYSAVNDSKVDAFVDAFSINDDISKAEKEADKIINEAAQAEAPDSGDESTKAQDADAGENKEKKSAEKSGKTKVGLLILYILLAVPVCAFLVLLLLIAAAAFLGLGAAIGKVAVLAIGSAFGCYAVFADILAVLGAALIMIALAILFAWVAVWLVGGVIVNLIKGAFGLANKLCIKEAKP